MLSGRAGFAQQLTCVLLALSAVAPFPVWDNNDYDLPDSVFCNASPTGTQHEFHHDFLKAQIIANAGTMYHAREEDVPPMSTRGGHVWPPLNPYQEPYLFKLKWQDLKEVGMIVLVTKDSEHHQLHISIAVAWVMAGDKADPCEKEGGNAKRNLPMANNEYDLPKSLFCMASPTGAQHEFHHDFLKSQIIANDKSIKHIDIQHIPKSTKGGILWPISADPESFYLFKMKWQDLKEVSLLLYIERDDSRPILHISVANAWVMVGDKGDPCDQAANTKRNLAITEHVPISSPMVGRKRSPFGSLGYEPFHVEDDAVWELPSELTCFSAANGGSHIYHESFLKSQILANALRIRPIPHNSGPGRSIKGPGIPGHKPGQGNDYIYALAWQKLKTVSIYLTTEIDHLDHRQHIGISRSEVADSGLLCAGTVNPPNQELNTKRTLAITEHIPINSPTTDRKRSPSGRFDIKPFHIDSDAVWDLPATLQCSSSANGQVHTYHGWFLKSQIIANARYIRPVPSKPDLVEYLYTLVWPGLKDVAIYLITVIDYQDPKHRQSIQIFESKVVSSGIPCLPIAGS